MKQKEDDIVRKAKKSCCDCSILSDFGRLTHAIQDSYYHSFNSWRGWHWNTLNPSDSLPVREESELDSDLAKNGGEKRLKEIVGNMSKSRKDPNSAYHNLDKALESTTELMKKIIERINDAGGASCWKTLVEQCSVTPSSDEDALIKEVERSTGRLPPYSKQVLREQGYL